MGMDESLAGEVELSLRRSHRRANPLHLLAWVPHSSKTVSKVERYPSLHVLASCHCDVQRARNWVSPEFDFDDERAAIADNDPNIENWRCVTIRSWHGEVTLVW